MVIRSLWAHASPTGLTFPITMSGTPQVLVPRQLFSTPPQPPRPARNAYQFDAMAVRVAKLHQQREKEREQYKADIVQKEMEVAETKARWQKEADQKMAEYQEHFKRMESLFKQDPSNQVIREQRSQRDLEIQAEEFQDKTTSQKNSLQHKRKAKRN